jgi:hypothetical protein
VARGLSTPAARGGGGGGGGGARGPPPPGRPPPPHDRAAGLLAEAAGTDEFEHRLAVRLEPACERRRARGVAVRRRPPFDRDRPDDVVETAVAQHDAFGPGHRRQHLAAPAAYGAAHLEHVAEVRVVVHRHGDVDRLERMAAHDEPLVARVRRQQDPPHDVQVVRRQPHGAVVHQVGVGRVDHELRRIGPQRRAQQQRRGAADRDLEARQEARAAVVQPLLATAVRVDVAAAVEHRERVVALEHVRAVVDAARRRPHVVRVRDLDELRHRNTPRSKPRALARGRSA